MLLECGDRRFDLSHRMLVLGLADDESGSDAWIAAGADALVTRSSSTAGAVCDRVDVPVGVQSRSGQVEFPDVVVPAVGPLDEVGAARIGRLVAEIRAGRRALVVTDPTTFRSDRRVAEVMARLLAAEHATSVGGRE